MIPSDMNLRIGKIKNYNNKILESKSYFKLGINKKINLNEEKGKPEGEGIVKIKAVTSCSTHKIDQQETDG